MQLAQMITGYWLSQAVYVAAKLGLADRLAAGPQPAADLAQAVGAHPEALYRLLRALASVGVFVEEERQCFALTELGAALRQDAPNSLRPMAIMMGEEHFLAWSQLLHSVRTGQRGWDQVFDLPPFEFLACHPEQAAIFDEAMVSVHGRETAAIADAGDFSAIGTIMDIGGGNGSMLAMLLHRNPNLRGILFDLPNVIERARAPIAAAGLTERCQLMSGNFFDSVPAGAKVYFMRHIIHDWTDEECTVLLKNVRRAVPPDGRLLVVESVIPPGNEPFFGKLLDLNMLVIPGGRERTAAEYRALYATAGFRLSRIIPTASEVSLIEGLPAE
ncbi:MAG TPA: methyltransferase [Pirellulales bacterium]|jgi:hypothetical protein|nr:methyltransferase [Pirellulales bacterium]